MLLPGAIYHASEHKIFLVSGVETEPVSAMKVDGTDPYMALRVILTGRWNSPGSESGSEPEEEIELFLGSMAVVALCSGLVVDAMRLNAHCDELGLSW